MQFSSVLITRLQLTIVLSLFFFGGGGGCPIATNPDYFQPGFTFRVVFSVEVGLLFFPFTMLLACQ